ncbi:hypothetical protein ES332_A08G160200v1 [Gossypium tomentosum]|uniref:2'-phosphotransferase n=1 Tax=Gossypium tomentosum TaxID=34277 RepID=A0A5D2PJQ1_GOSTO|nr:hypothetical protein ES332_A08G160200v1 [Gossypium tomentosum]TYI15030.1 hypothetical protein ES332_A08G160200v1 [Gossypium tomentosum]
MWSSLTNGSIRILRCCVTRRPTVPSQLSRFLALHLLENTVPYNTMSSSFSSFAHSNRSGGRGQDMKHDRERSRGRGGGGSKDKIDALGRLLTRILRHMATELNLNMRSDGYVKVEDLLKLNMKTFANIPLRSHTVDDIKEAVRKDNKQRFSLLEENGELLIRANQGHTVTTVESERLLKQIVSADEVQFCVHGTYKRNLESILESGLKRMERLHVHFSSGLPTDGEVISGMRRDVNVLIYLDVRKALEACKQGKNRERTSKNGSADELNRGYFDDMSELKQHVIALANNILIPELQQGSFLPWMLYIVMVENQSC